MVLADSPLSRIRCARAAFDLSSARPVDESLNPDLLDANETTWAFAPVDGVGRVNNTQVKRLATLASSEAGRSYCGRTADARLCVRTESAERARALAV